MVVAHNYELLMRLELTIEVLLRLSYCFAAQQVVNVLFNSAVDYLFARHLGLGADRHIFAKLAVFFVHLAGDHHREVALLTILAAWKYYCILRGLISRRGNSRNVWLLSFGWIDFAGFYLAKSEHAFHFCRTIFDGDVLFDFLFEAFLGVYLWLVSRNLCKHELEGFLVELDPWLRGFFFLLPSALHG